MLFWPSLPKAAVAAAPVLTNALCCLLCAAPSQVYAGPLAGGDRAVVLANFGTLHSQYPTTNLTVFWQQIGLQPGQRVAVRDLYAGAAGSWAC